MNLLPLTFIQFFIFLSVSSETCYFDFLLWSVNNNSRVGNLRGRYWSDGFVVFLWTQGVPPSDNYPSSRGRLPCHHVELQEVQRLIHGAIRGLLQDVNKSRKQDTKGWAERFVVPVSARWSISEEMMNWKLISCNSLKKKQLPPLMICIGNRSSAGYYWITVRHLLLLP